MRASQFIRGHVIFKLYYNQIYKLKTTLTFHALYYIKYYFELSKPFKPFMFSKPSRPFRPFKPFKPTVIVLQHFSPQNIWPIVTTSFWTVFVEEMLHSNPFRFISIQSEWVLDGTEPPLQMAMVSFNKETYPPTLHCL